MTPLHGVHTETAMSCIVPQGGMSHEVGATGDFNADSTRRPKGGSGGCKRSAKTCGSHRSIIATTGRCQGPEGGVDPFVYCQVLLIQPCEWCFDVIMTVTCVKNSSSGVVLTCYCNLLS